MRKKTVGLFTPYLDVMGGGEKHILSIMKVFDEAGYVVKLFWENDLSAEIESKLHLHFENLRFEKNLRNMSFIEKARYLSPLEWMFYVTDGSYFFSPAKKTAIFCMVPDKNLYRMSPLNSLKTSNAHFITNSRFTATNLKKWGTHSSVLYPYIPDELFLEETPIKKPYILSVGRFFRHLHAKRQDALIESFLKFRHRFPEYSLVLAGGVKKEDEEYVVELKRKYNDPSIRFYTNVSFDELSALYKYASFYWHFTGFGVDPAVNPQQVEHLGITPLEAMASRAVVFCYSAGGPRELIENGKNGFLFASENELLQQANYILHSPGAREAIRERAYRFVRDEFSYTVFTKHVKKLFSI